MTKKHNENNLKEQAHIIQGELNPNFKKIFQTLQEKEILSKEINVEKWEQDVDIILEELQTYKNYDRDSWIDLKYFCILEDLKEGANQAVKVHEEFKSKKREFEDDGKGQLQLYDNEAYNTFWKLKYTVDYINKGLANIQMSEYSYGYGRLHIKIFSTDINRLLTKSPNDEELTIVWNKVVDSKGLLEFSINAKKLIESLIGKIHILKGLYTKNNFIEQFEKRKEQKMKISKRYFWYSVGLFTILMIINVYIFIVNRDNSVNFSDFVGNFLGRNIYLFSVEVLMIVLAFYFLWLFKTYQKIIELYDSYILTIESDFYYKNDEYFLRADSEKVIEMRKENAQKIHELSGKIFDIFNGKDSFSSELPIGKAMNIIENLTKK